MESMTQRSTALAVVLTLVVAFAAPAAASSLGYSAIPSGDATADAGTANSVAQENNSTDSDSVQPGEKLAGVVSVQAAEVSGEVEERAFGHRIAAANSNRSKAAVVASESSELESRLSDISAEQESLKEKYENGEISKGQYKARTAKLVAEARTIQRLLNTTASTAEALPADDLKANGVSVESINDLRATAKNATGPEVSEMAKEIAGNDVGKTPPGLSNKTPGNASTGGPGNSAGDTPGNGSGGAPGTGSAGTPGNGQPGNGSVGTPGNGQPGNGSVGTPGNDTPVNETLGNGTAGNGTTGLPGNANGSNSGNSSAPGNSGNSSNVTLSLLATFALELDESIATIRAHV